MARGSAGWHVPRRAAQLPAHDQFRALRSHQPYIGQHLYDDGFSSAARHRRNRVLERLASSVTVVVALCGFVLIWLGIDMNHAAMASCGGMLFGGAVMHGVFGR